MHRYPQCTDHWPGTPVKNMVLKRNTISTHPVFKFSIPAFLQPVILPGKATGAKVPAIAYSKPVGKCPLPAVGILLPASHEPLPAINGSLPLKCSIPIQPVIVIARPSKAAALLRRYLLIICNWLARQRKRSTYKGQRSMA